MIARNTNHKLLFILLLALWYTPTSAAVNCLLLFQKKQQLAKEIEVPKSNSLLNILTTTDGLFLTAIPANSRQDFIKKHLSDLNSKEIRNLTWSNASMRLRNAALIEIGKTVDFATNRAVPGLSVLRKISFIAKYNFKFKGKHYAEGDSVVLDLDSFVMNLIEYACGRGCVESGSFFELHFRGTDAVQLDTDVRQFFEKILPNLSKDYLASPTSDHVHVVAVKPMNYVAANRSRGISDNTSARALTIYHSLVELDMILGWKKLRGDWRMFERRAKPEAPPTMSFLQADRMLDLFEFYEAIVDGKNLDINKYSTLGTHLKKNNAGARWGTAYDNPDLWGIELRFPSYDTSKSLVPIANGVKQTLDTQDFRFNPETVARFANDDIQDFLSKSWFSIDPLENIYQFQDPALKALAQEAFDKWNPPIQKVDYDGAILHHVNILFFVDWSSHPYFSTKPELVDRIKKTQKNFFEKIINGNMKPGDIDKFFKETGIRAELDYIVRRIPK